MTREIKFRAWDGNKMTSEIRLEFAHGLRLVSTSDLGFDMVGDDKCELMQFTGLKDKNGKEIYEGDIIKTESFAGGTMKGIVEFCEKDLAFMLNKQYLIGRWENEIIGNIYENPKLLK